MTKISMDPEAMAAHASVHTELSTIIEGKLNAIPAAVDGGLAADTITAIMQQIGNGVDALYRINGTMGEIVEAIADDSITTEEAATERLAAVAKELDELDS
jgi:hypothetical protein